MRCFVISPIGAAGSDVREHADDVFEYIIAPACSRAGITAERADHDTRPGVITEQMYDAILGHELLIAVLSFHNPNVFYEIAVAEAAARPLILMIQAGDAIPFDIKDRRVLTYDLRPRALFSRTHQDTLFRAIQDTVAASRSGQRTVPFRPSLSPLGVSTADDFQMIERTNLFDPKLRIAHLERASEFVLLRAIAWSNPPLRDELFVALRAAIARGVNVKMLLMAPDNPGLEHQVRKFTTGYIKTMQGEIANGIELWNEASGGQIEIRLQTGGFMQGMLQASEKEVIYTPYGLAKQTADSPLFCMRADHTMARIATEEFEQVWKHMSRPTKRRHLSSSPKAASRGRAPSSRRR